MLTIALDAMGGDHAPEVEVEGAVLAVRQYGVKVILVGLADRVRAELERLGMLKPHSVLSAANSTR